MPPSSFLATGRNGSSSSAGFSGGGGSGAAVVPTGAGSPGLPGFPVVPGVPRVPGVLLPGVGVAMLMVAPSVLRDRKSQPGENAAARAGAYGGALGLITVGGYLSYQDYQAAP